MNHTVRYTLASLTLLFWLGFFVATPGAVLPFWRGEFGVLGGMAAFFDLQLAGLLAGVWLATRLRNRQPAIPLGAGAMAAAYLVMSLAPSFVWLVAAAGAGGVAQGLLNVHANGLVGELHPRTRVLMLNRINAAFGVGAIAAPLLLTMVPWRWGFALAALGWLIGGALAWGAPAVRERLGAPDPAALLRVMPLLAAVGLYVAVESSISAWSGAYLTELGYPVRLAGFLLAGYWFLLTLSRLGLAPWVAADPLHRLFQLALASLAVLGLILWPPLAPLFPLAAVFYGPIFATSFAALQARYGQELTAGMFYAAAVGGTLGPALFALIPDPRSIPLGFLVLAALLLLALWRASRAA